MYYEIYIDVLFLRNFMMDTLLLWMVGRILRCIASYPRIVLGGVLGATGACVLILLPFSSFIPGVILTHAVINTAMIVTGLRIHDKKIFVKAFGLLYVQSILMAGIMEFFRPYVRICSLFFAVAVCSAFILCGVWRFISYIRERCKTIYPVTLFTEDGEYKLQGLLDTGNHLRDPYSGKPVSIIDHHMAKQLLGTKELSTIRYVPFRSVGGESSMPAVKMKRMCIHGERDCWVDAPVIGICEETISEKEEYEMILNPELIGGI